MLYPQNVAVPQLVTDGRHFIWGVDNTGAEPQVTNCNSKAWFVSPATGAVGGNGETPLSAFSTMQEAVDNSLMTSYDVIYVLDSLSETVVTPDYTEAPSYISIIGVGPSGYSPSWESGAAASPCLDMRAVGWRVSGFRFLAPTTEACIQLRHTDTGANDIAIRTQISDNLFDGLTTGRYGIATHGCYDVWIVNNVFQLFHNAVAGGAIAVWLQTSPLAIPYRQHINGNVFWDNDNHVICPMNGSEVVGNRFQQNGYAYAATQVLQTSVGGNPGDDNIVTENIFEGDYSIAGGFTAGAADYWMGNRSDDVAEAEVTADGWTVARPA